MNSVDKSVRHRKQQHILKIYLVGVERKQFEFFIGPTPCYNWIAFFFQYVGHITQYKLLMLANNRLQILSALNQLNIPLLSLYI